MTGEQSEIGVNKYINNLLGATDGNRQRGLSFKGPTTISDKSIQPKAFSANMKPKKFENKMQGISRSKLLRDFPLDLIQNNNQHQSLNGKSESNLFLIPEKTLEYDLLSFFPEDSKGGNLEVERKDSVSKLLTFGEEDVTGEQNEEIDQLGDDIEHIKSYENYQNIGSPLPQLTFQSKNWASPEQKKDFNTPTKRNSPLAEIKFNFFNTVTTKKEPQSKLFLKELDSDEMKSFDPLRNKGEDGEIISESEELGQNNRSRFDLDYEVLEVKINFFFGLIYVRYLEVDILGLFINARTN